MFNAKELKKTGNFSEGKFFAKLERSYNDKRYWIVEFTKEHYEYSPYLGRVKRRRLTRDWLSQKEAIALVEKAYADYMCIQETLSFYESEH